MLLFCKEIRDNEIVYTLDGSVSITLRKDNVLLDESVLNNLIFILKDKLDKDDVEMKVCYVG